MRIFEKELNNIYKSFTSLTTLISNLTLNKKVSVVQSCSKEELLEKKFFMFLLKKKECNKTFGLAELSLK